jgi:hypothetical protein
MGGNVGDFHRPRRPKSVVRRWRHLMSGLRVHEASHNINPLALLVGLEGYEGLKRLEIVYLS